MKAFTYQRADSAAQAAAAVGVQVGATIVATRVVVDQLGPATLAALRYAIGLASLLPFVWHAVWHAARREAAAAQARSSTTTPSIVFCAVANRPSSAPVTVRRRSRSRPATTTPTACAG